MPLLNSKVAAGSFLNTKTNIQRVSLVCRPNFTGPNCSVVLDHCLTFPCQHGGNCTSSPSGFTCHCKDGYHGDTCQYDTDECQSAPCSQNATCVDAVNGYYCQCLQGYSGTHCEKGSMNILYSK